ncbi:MAG: SAM-dependent methyltransferase [Anaerolineaceae bacterium]|nr:SAM-dependent methyltransferase [Anaerolineaceae bacterium]
MNIQTLQKTFDSRTELFSLDQYSAYRLFNGFIEGQGNLVVDYYGTTLLIYDYQKKDFLDNQTLNFIQSFYLTKLPFLQTVILKRRFSKEVEEKRGVFLLDGNPTREITEFGVRYAIDVLLNQDAGFYLDTRNLRKWLLESMAGKTVLNTFAYTGSLGVAAAAGGANRVIQTDLNKRFLNLAKTSYSLNGFPINKADFQAGDFFKNITRLKKENSGFDCVILDPPFFSTTAAGKVDLVHESVRLINKVRPLVNHQGYLVVINNALFLSGKEYLAKLNELFVDGYLEMVQHIPVPLDISGFPETKVRPLPADPSPFNHATKIVVLKVFRKNTH